MDYSELTDQDVVARALEGRESAHRELIGRYQRPVVSLVYRLVNDRELAEDLAQETFIKVFRALRRYDPKQKFSSWIFKIAHNTAIDQLRRKELDTLSLDGSPHATTAEAVQRTTVVAVSEDETPEEYVANRELGREIDGAIARLRPEYRSAVVLRHVEGRAYDEIAEILGVPLGTVKTYIHRARNELRQMLAHVRAETPSADHA